MGYKIEILKEVSINGNNLKKGTIRIVSLSLRDSLIKDEFAKLYIEKRKKT
ncbi:MAG: hypothetical protein JJW00_00245, partial [Sulfurimonas sp.]|nr:hypothetical protein [Sulfurimonas sp.]